MPDCRPCWPGTTLPIRARTTPDASTAPTVRGVGTLVRGRRDGSADRVRRDGRADECAALEKPWGSGPRGFESNSLRCCNYYNDVPDGRRVSLSIRSNTECALFKPSIDQG